MKLHIVFLLCVTFSCAVCRDIKREDSSYWSSIYVESASEGPFMIAGIDPDGKHILLENLSDGREYLNGWTIKQKTDNRPGVSYTFQFCSIPPNRKRKIVANKWSYNASATDFVATDVGVWGTGSEVKTYLYDRNSTAYLNPYWSQRPKVSFSTTCSFDLSYSNTCTEEHLRVKSTTIKPVYKA